MPRHAEHQCSACQRPMAKAKMKSGGSGLRCKPPHGCAAEAKPEPVKDPRACNGCGKLPPDACGERLFPGDAKLDGCCARERGHEAIQIEHPVPVHCRTIEHWALCRDCTADEVAKFRAEAEAARAAAAAAPTENTKRSRRKTPAAKPAPGSYAHALGRINRKGKPVDETERCDICGCAGGCDRGGGSRCCWTRVDGAPGPQRCLACAELLDTAREALEVDDLDGAALAKRLHDSTDMPCADDARVGKIVAIAIAEEKGAEPPVEVRGGEPTREQPAATESEADTRPPKGTRVRILKGRYEGRTGIVNRRCMAPFEDRLYVDLDPTPRERTKKTEQLGADEVEPISAAVEPPPPSDAPPPPAPASPKPAPAPAQPPLPGLGAARELTLPFPSSPLAKPAPLPSEQNAASVMAWLRAQAPDATFSVDEVAKGAAVLPARAFDAIETLLEAGRVETGGDEAPTRYRLRSSERPAAPLAHALADQRCASCGDAIVPGGPWAALPGGKRVCGKQACAERAAAPAPTAADRRENIGAAIRGVIDYHAAIPGDLPVPTESGLVRAVVDGLPGDVPREKLEAEVADVIGAMFERGELVQMTPSKPGQGTTAYYRRKGGPPADLRGLVGAAPTQCERDPDCESRPGHGGPCIPRPTVSQKDVERAARAAGMPSVMAAVLADVVTNGHDPGAADDLAAASIPVPVAVDLGGEVVLTSSDKLVARVGDAGSVSVHVERAGLDDGQGLPPVLAPDEEPTPLDLALAAADEIDSTVRQLREALRRIAVPPPPRDEVAQLRATLALVEQQRDEAQAALAAKTKAVEEARAELFEANEGHRRTREELATVAGAERDLAATLSVTRQRVERLRAGCERAVESLGATGAQGFTDDGLVAVLEEQLASRAEAMRQLGDDATTAHARGEAAARRIGALRAGIIETAGKLGRDTEPLLGLPDDALVADVLAAAAAARRPLRVPRIEEPAPVVSLVPGCPF